MSARVLGVAILAGLALLAGCSSSTPAAATTSLPEPRARHRRGDHTQPWFRWARIRRTSGNRLLTPADPSTVVGHPKFSYTEASTLPPSLQGILPAQYNTTTTVDAYSDVPASKKGPYPIVLFSHGYGGERLYYSTLLAGIASWGYVVVSADYLERGLAAQVLGTKTTAVGRPRLARSCSRRCVATEHASSEATSVLQGVADPHRVAAVGHSAGGRNRIRRARTAQRSRTAVGWAPVAPVGQARRPSRSC